MLNVNDKLGGLSINPTRIRAFREYIDVCKLMNLGFQGPKFTWTNKHSNWHNNIKERLHRSLINAEWKSLFPRAELLHLPRTKSDHCPVLLNTNPKIRISRKSFKFEQMCISDPSFP